MAFNAAATTSVNIARNSARSSSLSAIYRRAFLTRFALPTSDRAASR